MGKATDRTEQKLRLVLLAVGLNNMCFLKCQGGPSILTRVKLLKKEDWDKPNLNHHL